MGEEAPDRTEELATALVKRAEALLNTPAPPKYDSFRRYEGRVGGTEHRTAGGRAWCFQCSEWCYPESYACPCCEPKIEPDELRAALKSDQSMTDPPTGKVYLVWEWTEEREAKIHHAICSTLDKAKDAAQRLWDDECTLRGDPTSALDWKPSRLPLPPDAWVGEKGQRNNPGFYDDNDVPFEVEPFEIDVLLAGPQLTRITL